MYRGRRGGVSGTGGRERKEGGHTHAGLLNYALYFFDFFNFLATGSLTHAHEAEENDLRSCEPW